MQANVVSYKRGDRHVQTLRWTHANAEIDTCQRGDRIVYVLQTLR